MTAKPVPEHISDERLAEVRRLASVEENDCLRDGARSAAQYHADVGSALTELQHRREAEAGAPVAWIEKDALAKFAKDPHALTATVYRHQLDDTWAPLFAASPSSPASGVRVKALEFDEDVGWPRIARTPFGDYKIWAGKDVWFNHIWLRDMHAPSYETAKQWAQEDYEQRVLSAIGEHP